MTRRRRAGPRFSRKDANHDQFVRRLRMYPGVLVWETVDTGGGWPDAAICFRGRVYLVEIKDEGKRDQLTPAERKFQEQGWPVIVAEDPHEVLDVIGWSEAQVQSAPVIEEAGIGGNSEKRGNQDAGRSGR